MFGIIGDTRKLFGVFARLGQTILKIENEHFLSALLHHLHKVYEADQIIHYSISFPIKQLRTVPIKDGAY